MSSTKPQPILLDSRASLRCARRTHNDFDKTIVAADAPFAFPPQQQQLLDRGRDFEQEVRQTLLTQHGEDILDLSDLARERATLATQAAMAQGIALIVNGALPDDTDGGRRGRPDLLVRVTPQRSPYHRYAPVDIKSHRTLSRDATGSAQWTPTADLVRNRPPRTPFSTELETGHTWRENEKDALQLAHYWRLLVACDRACDEPMGGILGTPGDGEELVVVWIDLAEPRYKTFSRSAENGHTKRSALERYDHEFEFRLAVAQNATRMTGAATDPAALVAPIRYRECETCPWQQYCSELMGPQDASNRVATLGHREWLTLRNLGYGKVDDLAALNVTQIKSWRPDETADTPTKDLLDRYLPEVTNLPRAKTDLATAVTRAQMALTGEEFRRRTTGALEVPRADVEIDLDMENDGDSRIYLWGLLVTMGDESTYRHVSDLQPTAQAIEAHLVAQLWRELTTITRSAAERGESTRIYHYHSVETQGLRRIVDSQADPNLPSREELDAFIDEYFIDLYQLVHKNFIAMKSLGLKSVAQSSGFTWRFDGADGLQSIAWLRDYQESGDDELRKRLFDYNEDDVRATLHVRNWLETQ